MIAQRDFAERGLDADSLPIKLVFVAAEIEVALGELATIGPGYVFELKQAAASHIEIRANGQTIGNGELVEIDGRAGVRILSCGVMGQPPQNI